MGGNTVGRVEIENGYSVIVEVLPVVIELHYFRNVEVRSRNRKLGSDC